jgi:hypothetical protein
VFPFVYVQCTEGRLTLSIRLLLLIKKKLSTLKNIGSVVGLSCEGYEDQAVALLTAIEEDHSWEVKGACSRGRMELLNLECSINYEGASSRRGRGKAHVCLC